MAELEEAVAASSTAAASPAAAAAAAAAESSPVAASSSNMRKSSLGSVVLYVPLPIQKVWDIVSDLFGERYGWPTQVSITPLTLNGVSGGARRRVADKADPQQAWVIERLVAVEPQEYWYTYTVDECPEPSIIGSSGLMQLFSEKSLAEGEEEKTRVVWSYALLPQEGEQFVPRTRMEQVRQTLVAYLMGIEDLDHGHLADDSSSDESDSDDDEPPPAHTQALHTQQGLLVNAPTEQQQEEATQFSTQRPGEATPTLQQEEDNPTQQQEEDNPTQQQEEDNPTQQQEEATQSPTQQQEATQPPTQQQQQEATQPPTQQQQEAPQPPIQPQQEEAPKPPTQPQQEATQTPTQRQQDVTQSPTQPQEATPTHQQATPTHQQATPTEQQQEAAPDNNNETESANQDVAAFQQASRPENHPPPV